MGSISYGFSLYFHQSFFWLMIFSSMMDYDGGIDEDLQEYIPKTCSDSPAPGSYTNHYTTL